MRKITHIVLHTAAHGNSLETAKDTTAKEIDSWHRQRGWRMIGYHFVVRFDGAIEVGRPLEMVPAHVAGFNSTTVGICFSGSGDHKPLTMCQLRTGLMLCRDLCKQFNLTPDAVIGHREINALVPPKYKTTKSCPGKMVDLDNFRKVLKGML